MKIDKEHTTKLLAVRKKYNLACEEFMTGKITQEKWLEEEKKLGQEGQKIRRSIGFIFLLLLVVTQTFAHPIDMKALAEIESSNNPKAYNVRTQASGLYQITPIVLKQWWSEPKERAWWLSERNPLLGSFARPEHLFSPILNQKVANYYLNWLSQRCDTVDEILIAWNWGIGNLRRWRTSHSIHDPNPYNRDLPEETQDFLKKYHKLTEATL